ncbi:hypothetical protein JB92DRAFT_2955041 [Gautieria morchelliformis]|nr:hypothetical protein JB92DRAFT_2955041 [Gautieria morchelliformis]
MSESSPPHYVLLAHSHLSSSPSHASVSNTPTLTHPIIRYQFRDDPPLSPLNNAHVLVMDYDPASPELARVQSLSPQLAITALKVSDAPGVGSMAEDEEPKNTKMYVLETVAHPPTEKGTAADDLHPVASLTGFKQRNSMLRKALEYPLPSGASLQPPSAPASAHTVSPRPSPPHPSAALPPHELSP